MPSYLLLANLFELAFQLPEICNQLDFCKTTTFSGFQIACNLQSVALCLQLQLAFKLPTICNPLLFACNFNWHSNCLQFTINLLSVSYNFNRHSTCLQFAIPCSLPTTSTDIQIARKFAIRLLFAYNYHFATRFLDLHLLCAQCLRKVNSDISQIICEPSHANNCILSARHALILMVLLYSDPVQAFENVILTICSETHLIT